MNGSALTYDAFGRMVEGPTANGTREYLYTAGGSQVLAQMNGQTPQKVQYPLPGGGVAIYTGSFNPVLTYARPDWLGSSRLVTSSTKAMISDSAYAPFGEQYAVSGSSPLYDFTGQQQWTTAGLADFLFRKYHPTQGRWISPDPVGMGAVDVANPQTWNRYAYVANNPLNAVDPLGLCPRNAYPENREPGPCVEVHGFGCAIDPACSGNGVIVDGILTSAVVAQALLDVGLAKPCSPCSGWVTDENGNPVWVQFQVHDVGSSNDTNGHIGNGVQPGFFDSSALPDDGKGVTVLGAYGSPTPPWRSPQPALIEAPGPAGSLQPCVWGTKKNTICLEGFGGRF